MLRKEDFAVIQALKNHDVYLKDIAAELGVHPKTVSRSLRRGSAPSAVGRRRPSKLVSTVARYWSIDNRPSWSSCMVEAVRAPA